MVGYPAEERSKIETLATAANRKQLENLLKEVTGREWTLKLIPQAGTVGCTAQCVGGEKDNGAAADRAGGVGDVPGRNQVGSRRDDESEQINEAGSEDAGANE